jgi:hypothetical protein
VEREGPDSRHTWLINEAVEAPLQFPKNREMIFQLREALFADDKSVLKIYELSTARRVGLAFLDLPRNMRADIAPRRRPGSENKSTAELSAWTP